LITPERNKKALINGYTLVAFFVAKVEFKEKTLQFFAQYFTVVKGTLARVFYLQFLIISPLPSRWGPNFAFSAKIDLENIFPV